ncbi:MAG: UbiA prenyltransferase family protein [Bacteroidetes bacterium]|nr:UbiA prenyltransferase family protein [Bacteroidota bacterium]
MHELILLPRPKHWVKNLLIFLPSILDGNLFINLNWIHLSAGFVSFSLVASSGYIFNDIRDIDEDRQHPVKRNRSLASATIKVRYAFIYSLVLLFCGLGISVFLGLKPLGILILYSSVNWIYSIVIKSVRFLDIIILTGFYIIRLVYGATIANVELTGWFIITIAFACLALSTNKRQILCSINTKDKTPGRTYTKQDIIPLQIFAIGFGIISLVFLNIHSYFVLLVRNPYSIMIINLIAVYLIMSYFDTSKDLSDDPVERILKNPTIIIMTLILFGFYVFELLRS